MIPRILLVLLLGAPICDPGSAGATLTDPVLGISRATRAAGLDHELLLVEAQFPFDDLVQLAVPLQLLVFDTVDGDYVRIDVSGSAFTGRSPALVDGLEPAEAQALLQEGVPTASVELTGLLPGRLVVQSSRGQLPTAAPSTRVQLFLLREGEVTLSNAIVSEVVP